MQFANETDGVYLEIEIIDSKGVCLPSSLTTKFKLSPITTAADNMKDGVRIVPTKPKVKPASI